ncbi:hypothetical protein RHSIM_RhsimUnG0147800 [Rhododendron simsii]|uniref:Retrovirus-related Pol polyprotein from transposon TNT 1-94 n=1 Tax=Rhododendron simsii TaxID=118357 RepID=A0A834L2G7_RHOSS|nr:hypothetical protein RHSIM_RhsimUnG0147800 [Rhododendron simsii]
MWRTPHCNSSNIDRDIMTNALVGYSDSDFVGCQDFRKSTLGYVFMLAGGVVLWKSAKETIVASSTMEAEFIACFEASSQAVWLKNFITGL